MPDSPARGYRGHEGAREWVANLKAATGSEGWRKYSSPHGH